MSPGSGGEWAGMGGGGDVLGSEGGGDGGVGERWEWEGV